MTCKQSRVNITLWAKKVNKLKCQTVKEYVIDHYRRTFKENISNEDKKILDRCFLDQIIITDFLKQYNLVGCQFTYLYDFIMANTKYLEENGCRFYMKKNIDNREYTADDNYDYKTKPNMTIMRKVLINRNNYI